MSVVPFLLFSLVLRCLWRLLNPVRGDPLHDPVLEFCVDVMASLVPSYLSPLFPAVWLPRTSRAPCYAWDLRLDFSSWYSGKLQISLHYSGIYTVTWLGSNSSVRQKCDSIHRFTCRPLTLGGFNTFETVGADVLINFSWFPIPRRTFE